MANLNPKDEVELKECFKDRLDGDHQQLFVKSVHPSEHVKEPWIVVVNENGEIMTKRLFTRDRSTGQEVPTEPATMFPQHYFAKKEAVTSGR